MSLAAQKRAYDKTMNLPRKRSAPVDDDAEKERSMGSLTFHGAHGTTFTMSRLDTDLLTQASRRRRGSADDDADGEEEEEWDAENIEETSSEESPELEDDEEQDVRDRGAHSRGSTAATLTSESSNGSDGGRVLRDDDADHTIVVPEAALVARPRAVMPMPVALGNQTVCPVCFEQVAIEHARVQAMQAGGEIEGVSARAMESIRSTKARTATVGSVTKRYEMLFSLYDALRVTTNNSQLYPMMLQLHQMLIEEPLRSVGEPYTVWTLVALRTHFHPVTGHVFDNVQHTKVDLASVISTLDKLEESLFVRNPANPAQDLPHTKAISNKVQLIALKQKLVDKLSRVAMSTAQDNKAAIFSMMTLVQGATNDGARQLLQNPQAAAGTLQKGGDLARTAGKSRDTAVGTAHDMHALSGY